MHTYAALCSILLLSALSSGQSGRAIPGYCPYGCGPYIPLITTPRVSFATVSPNSTGATNASAGLVAGATDSTLSEVSAHTDAVYTMPVWYAGGQTLLMLPISSAPPTVNSLAPERRMRPTECRPKSREEMRGEKIPQLPWIYFSSAEQTIPPKQAVTAGNLRKAARIYSNEDVMRQNQQNGLVKYETKPGKIQ